MAKAFMLEILTPDRVFFTDTVESVIITTSSGEMGILYNTMPMVTTIESGIIRFCQKGKWKEALSSAGFVEITDKGAIIMPQTCQWPHEIDYEKVNDEIDAAQELLKKKQSLQEYQMAKAQLQMQFAKLKLKGRRDD